MTSALSAAQLLDLLKQSPPLVEGLQDLALQVQPNGVELTLQLVQRFVGQGCLDFTNNKRILAKVADVQLDQGYYDLTPGPYLVMFNEILHLPLNAIAIGKPRSSLLRMGASLGTAIWDAGYNGRSQSLLVIHNPAGIRLYPNARLAQLVFFWLERETAPYAGVYQNENI
jgi:dUTP pyrophosphatase